MFRIKIIRDDDAESPNLCDEAMFLVSNHRDLSIDMPEDIDVDEYDSWEVAVTSHGTISLAIAGTQHECQWDTVRCARVFVKRSIFDNKLKQYQAAESFIECWQQYCDGDIWGFVIETSNDCSHCGHAEWEKVDDARGFYGQEDCISEATASLKALDPNDSAFKIVIAA